MTCAISVGSETASGCIQLRKMNQKRDIQTNHNKRVYEAG
jgi:hypothetical protein